MLSRLEKPTFFELRENGTVKCYWNPEVSGKWVEDTSTGKSHAETLIEYMRTTDQPVLLGHVVRDIVKRGKFDGVETGFFQCIAERCIIE